MVRESPVYPERWFWDLHGDSEVQVDYLLFAGYHGEFDGGMSGV